MPPENKDEQRREIIRRLEYQNQRLEAELLEAETKAAELRQKHTAASGARLRAEGPFPAGEPCPECWITHGRDIQMYCIPADDPKDYDRWKCGECGYFEDRRFWKT
jgi:hypothetical protein